MTFSWQKFDPDCFASFQRLMGVKVRKVGDTYWTAVRPLFYRPLWPLQEMDPGRITLPLASHLGAAQYAVQGSTSTNSLINHLAFEQTSEYSSEKLPRKSRKQVRLAAAALVIRPITEVAEFKVQAFPVYQSFHERTKYEVGSKRQDPDYFHQWADTLFNIPGVLILGGYHEGVLRGISLSFLLGDTVNYASFFCDAQALELYLPDLMLHSIREAAANTPEIRRIYVGLYKGNRGLDGFKLIRGASLIRQPAFLILNPLTRIVLRNAMPQQFAQMLGHLTEAQLLEAGVKPIGRRSPLDLAGSTSS